MISADANADLLQVGNCLDAAARCCCILAEHPEWVWGPRWLSIRSWCDNPGDMSMKYDHINPVSWLGNVYIKDVVILTSWTVGWHLAERELQDAGFPVPFSEMERARNIDMLLPFGDGKIVLLNRLSEGEREEDEDKQDIPLAAHGPSDLPPIPSETIQDNAKIHKPNLENMATELLHQSTTQAFGHTLPNHTSYDLYDAYIEIDSSNSRHIWQHKSTICHILSEPHTALESTDHLKHVRGYSCYQDIKMNKTEIPLGSTEGDQTNAILQTQDPTAFLVRSKDLIWLAVGEIVTIRQSGKAVDILPVQTLAEPNIQLTTWIMQLVGLFGNDEGDWEWTGQFTRSTCDLEGHSIQLLNPTIIRSTRPGHNQMPTYCFKSSELLAIAALLYSNLNSEINALPSVPWSEMFPYRTPNGMPLPLFSIYSVINQSWITVEAVCFICEDEDSARGVIQDQHQCFRCPSLWLSKLSPSELVTHMGMHILHDEALKNVVNPCGFCLALGSLCLVQLKKGQFWKVGMQIDLQNTHCQHSNQVKLSLTSFAKSTSASPCTNVPILCPLCPASSEAMWKYNLEAHLKVVHPTASIAEHKELYEISKSEWVALKAAFILKPRWTAKCICDLGNINISKAHSSHVVLRYAY